VDLIVVKVVNLTTSISAAFDVSNAKITLNLHDHAETYELEAVRGEVKLKAVGYFSPDQIAKMLVDKAASMVL
jgi:hypothetical protein